jgi:hypothetical protein
MSTLSEPLNTIHCLRGLSVPQNAPRMPYVCRAEDSSIIPGARTTWRPLPNDGPHARACGNATAVAPSDARAGGDPLRRLPQQVRPMRRHAAGARRQHAARPCCTGVCACCSHRRARANDSHQQSYRYVPPHFKRGVLVPYTRCH